MDLIGPFQNSFISGRSTTDNVIVAQEILHHMYKSKRKRGYMAIKIGLFKAYDSVDWGLLKKTLIYFVFLAQTMELIMFCVSSASLSLIWNGVKLESFKPNRGLRQGDPLSSYLFVLCMEKLSMMIVDKVDAGVWKPVHLTQGGLGVSHPFFANDILLFTEAKVTEMRMIMKVLKEFEEASGLMVSNDKSKAMVSKNASRQNKERLMAASSIPFSSSMGNYLGFPLLQGRIKKVDFNFFLDKLKARLSGWKVKLLNKAGRVTLARSILTTMPLYNMQTHKLTTGNL